MNTPPTVSLKRNPKRSDACLGFTLVELLAVIAIVAILVGILIPISMRVRERMEVTASLSNLRQIGVGAQLYVADNDGYYPALTNSNWSGDYWSKNIDVYIPGELYEKDEFYDYPGTKPVGESFMDPLLDAGRHNVLGDYGCNTEVMRRPDLLSSKGKVPASSIPEPSKLLFAMTAATSSKLYGSWYFNTGGFVNAGFTSSGPLPSPRADGAVLVVFCDGHADAIPELQFEENRRTLMLLNP